jgi:hypothetical protein
VLPMTPTVAIAFSNSVELVDPILASVLEISVLVVGAHLDID